MTIKIGCVSLIPVEDRFVAIKCSKNRGYILPGGKHEPGESFHETATRELREEAGLIAKNQMYLFSAPDAFDYICITFLTQLESFIRQPCEEEVGLATWEQLCQSFYRAYYCILRDYYNLHYHMVMTRYSAQNANLKKFHD